MADSFEEITDAWYEGVIDAEQRFIVVTEDHEFQIPNPSYSIENPTMQLMGYCGATPSTYEEQLPGKLLPTHDTIAGTRVIHQSVFTNGRWALKQSDWIHE
jgi:uncharacterized RDD family membrane protein YckC